MLSFPIDLAQGAPMPQGPIYSVRDVHDMRTTPLGGDGSRFKGEIRPKEQQDDCLILEVLIIIRVFLIAS